MRCNGIRRGGRRCWGEVDVRRELRFGCFTKAAENHPAFPALWSSLLPCRCATRATLLTSLCTSSVLCTVTQHGCLIAWVTTIGTCELFCWVLLVIVHGVARIEKPCFWHLLNNLACNHTPSICQNSRRKTILHDRVDRTLRCAL